MLRHVGDGDGGDTIKPKEILPLKLYSNKNIVLFITLLFICFSLIYNLLLADWMLCIYWLNINI